MRGHDASLGSADVCHPAPRFRFVKFCRDAGLLGAQLNTTSAGRRVPCVLPSATNVID